MGKMPARSAKEKAAVPQKRQNNQARGKRHRQAQQLLGLIRMDGGASSCSLLFQPAPHPLPRAKEAAYILLPHRGAAGRFCKPKGKRQTPSPTAVQCCLSPPTRVLYMSLLGWVPFPMPASKASPHWPPPFSTAGFLLCSAFPSHEAPLLGFVLGIHSLEFNSPTQKAVAFSPRPTWTHSVQLETKHDLFHENLTASKLFIAQQGRTAGIKTML